MYTKTQTSNLLFPEQVLKCSRGVTIDIYGCDDLFSVKILVLQLVLVREGLLLLQHSGLLKLLVVQLLKLVTTEGVVLEAKGTAAKVRILESKDMSFFGFAQKFIRIIFLSDFKYLK
jgi:hypothetical protein